MDPTVTKSILDDIIAPQAPVLVFTEGSADAQSLNGAEDSSGRWVVDMTEEKKFSSMHWVGKVKQFLKKWGGDGDDSETPESNGKEGETSTDAEM